jgi:hypothetical protein
MINGNFPAPTLMKIEFRLSVIEKFISFMIPSSLASSKKHNPASMEIRNLFSSLASSLL